MGDGLTSTTRTAASSFSELAAALGVSTENYTSNSAYPKYTPEQLVKSSGDELRGEIITNQLYEIIKERES